MLVPREDYEPIATRPVFPHPGRSWFRLDPVSLAWCRIAFGAIAFYTAIWFLIQYDSALGPSGCFRLADVPRYHHGRSLTAFSLVACLPVPVQRWAEQSVLVALAGSGAALAIGVWYRVFSVLTWSLYASVAVRVAPYLSAGDELLELLLFWMIFLPADQRWAILPTKRCRSLVTRVAEAGFVLQLVSVYVFNWLLKTDASWTTTYNALHLALAIDQYSSGLGQIALHYPGCLRVATATYYWLELLAPIAWLSLRHGASRRIICGCMIGIHFAMFALFRLDTFPFICIASWIALWPHPTVLMQAGADGGSTRAVRRSWRAAGTCAAVTGLTCCIALTLAWNIASVTRWVPPRPIRALAHGCLLAQKWDMFAPYPLTIDSYMCVVAACPPIGVYGGCVSDSPRPLPFPSMRACALARFAFGRSTKYIAHNIAEYYASHSLDHHATVQLWTRPSTADAFPVMLDEVQVVEQ